MDMLTIFGIAVALFAVLGGQYLEGGSVHSLLSFPAFLIVIGGSFGAIMLQTRLSVFRRAMMMVAWIVFPPRIRHEDAIRKIVAWSKVVRKEGILSLQNKLENEKNNFVKKGLEIIINGGNNIQLRRVLEVEIDTKEIEDMNAARVYESLGAYCPTVGILGAVLGLIHVMHNLAEPDKLGSGIAIAFIATVYGVGFANLFFLPVARKLVHIVNEQTRYHELLLEGLISVMDGEHPYNIEQKLRGFIGKK
ncbi:MAG: flagellar motor protein [Gammaproteobacteria bacterium]